MQILTIINQKGGVGKTTTATTLAHGLALRGWNVLLVDLDSQGNITDSLGLEKEPGLYRFVVDRIGTEAIVSSGREKLDVLSGDRQTASVKDRLKEVAFGEVILDKLLRELEYDLVILDAAPSVDPLQIPALVASDFFLIPVSLDHLAVVGASEALKSAHEILELGNLKAEFLGILPTFWERSTSETERQLEALEKEFEGWIWPPIPKDTKVREASARGQTIFEYSPRCRALSGVTILRKRIGGYAVVVNKLEAELTNG